MARFPPYGQAARLKLSNDRPNPVIHFFWGEANPEHADGIGVSDLRRDPQQVRLVVEFDLGRK